MKPPIQRFALRGIAIAAATLSFATFASGETALESRLSALLGQERKALSVVPSNRLSALTVPPVASSRGVETAPASLDYSEEMLAARPQADGDAQWECLSQALYFEARGESVRGVFAVGEVILNRVESASYPGSICNVVHQGTGRKYACQFTYTCDGASEVIHEPAAWDRVGKVARLLLDGAPRELTAGATHYHTRAVNPSWSRRFPRTAAIGSHYFYRQPTRTASN